MLDEIVSLKEASSITAGIPWNASVFQGNLKGLNCLCDWIVIN